MSYLLLSILLFLVRDVSIVLGLLLATFFVGLFGSSFEFLCDIDSDLLKCLFLLLFPICMIIGVGMAFKEIFCETVP